ncbi:MAG: hypothetical protein M1816_006676 [Peltula sp. TS41687]|nr:MAG: hypothetical protein M1816_006676 [Peltula sp. TS41687]
MVKQLTFKGDKKPKKRKRTATGIEDHDDSRVPNEETALIKASQSQVDDDDSWVTADAPTDVVGPIIFALPSDEPTCLACDANGKVFASQLENIVEGNLATAEPHDVRQVWVANKIAGVEGFSFKGHHGRYLGCDKFGHLSAIKEAISPEETFLCIPSPDTPDTFSIQTQRETFLTIAELSDTNTPEIRGDAESISFNTTFRIRMQARYKPKLKANKEEKAREKISRKQLEEAVGRRLDDDEARKLKKARREGNFYEAVLDHRVKGKHDKFASC